jgi:hypothetical protein
VALTVGSHRRGYDVDPDTAELRARLSGFTLGASTILLAWAATVWAPMIWEWLWR